MTRRPKDQAVGGALIDELLREVVDRDEATTALIENQLRREFYLQAVEMIKAEFRADSWQAFELSVTGNSARVSVQSIPLAAESCFDSAKPLRN